MNYNKIMVVPDDDYCVSAGTSCRYIKWEEFNGFCYEKYPQCIAHQKDLDLIINGQGFRVKKCSNCINCCAKED